MININKIKNLFFSMYYISSIGKIDYVFFSEKENYRYYFLPLINKLLMENKEVYYLSSDINDQIKSDKGNVKNFYIGHGFLRMVILLLLKCKYFFLTITDLGNNEFSKNKNIENYVYIFHGMMSTHKIYTEKAFDNYDLICCNGPYQFEEIRIREKKFDLKKKRLVKSGYLYLEYLNKNINLLKEKEYILFAPSWNYNNFNLLEKFSIKILSHLLTNNFKVIFRPHQEHYKRSKKTLNDIFLKFKKNSNLIIDQNANNLSCFEKSNFLISDDSGIVHEFLFTCQKPFIVFSDLKKIHNNNFLEIKQSSFEEEIYEKFGYLVNSSEIDNLKENILKAKIKFNNKKEQIENYISNKLYSKNETSKIIFDEIINN